MGLAIIVPSISFEDANLGKVTLSGNVPIRGLYINLENSYTGTTVDLKCSYLPANTTQRGVVWSIESGSEYASISGSTLTILQGASSSEVTIKCTSSSNSSIVAIKTIVVTYDGGGYDFNDEGYFNANLLSDGTIAQSAHSGNVLSTAKRRISNKNISIKIASGDIGVHNDNQIKIGEYDSSNNFIQRQFISYTGSNIMNFTLSATTTYIIVCVQISVASSQLLSAAKAVYNSIEFTGVTDTETDLTNFVDYE